MAKYRLRGYLLDRVVARVAVALLSVPLRICYVAIRLFGGDPRPCGCGRAARVQRTCPASGAPCTLCCNGCAADCEVLHV